MPDLAEAREQAVLQPGAILLEGHGSSERSFLFTDPVEWIEVRELSELPSLFARIEAAQEQGLWAAGYVGYECGYGWEPTVAPGFRPSHPLPLAAFGLYREPQLCTATARPRPSEVHLAGGDLDIGPEAFACKVKAVHRLIEGGDTYQVNLTDRFQANYNGSAAALFARMMEAQPVAYGAFLQLGAHTILSASPELFFHLRKREITMRPMKGTAARGRDAAEDAEQMRWLAADEKNRAENVMIVDLQRSDLGRIAEVGTVQVRDLFAVERLPSLLQMTSTVSATLRPEVTLYDIFASLFPSGSIVGAPKVRTMQIVRELESRERGPYTGAIGFVAPDGEAVFSVAIRTAVLAGDELTMGVGAGITYDSDPSKEYEECRLKCAFLSEEPFQLIETMRWEAGTCALLDFHLERLQSSAAYFGFTCDQSRVRCNIEAKAAQLPGSGAWKLRLTLDRGGILTWSTPELLQTDPERLKALLWPEPVRSGDRFLRHKTTRRAVYDNALRQARAQGFTDAVFRNEHGLVTEGAIHNIVVRHGDRRRTPPLNAGVLPGVCRAHLLATMPGLLEEPFTVEEMLDADEVWLCNALRGVRVLHAPCRQICASLPIEKEECKLENIAVGQP